MTPWARSGNVSEMSVLGTFGAMKPRMDSHQIAARNLSSDWEPPLAYRAR